MIKRINYTMNLAQEHYASDWNYICKQIIPIALPLLIILVITSFFIIEALFMFFIIVFSLALSLLIIKFRIKKVDKTVKIEILIDSKKKYFIVSSDGIYSKKWAWASIIPEFNNDCIELKTLFRYRYCWNSIIIPKRAFSSYEEMCETLNLIEDNYKKNKDDKGVAVIIVSIVCSAIILLYLFCKGLKFFV